MINSSLSVLFPGNSESPIATTVIWIVLVLVVQLPMVSIYYREKHTFDELPTRENYYNDLNGNLRDQVQFKLKNTGSTSEANLHWAGLKMAVQQIIKRFFYFYNLFENSFFHRYLQ